MSERDERLELEISLVESMYPDQAKYTVKARELSYKSEASAVFTLRLPAGYLEDDLPEVLSAHIGRIDLREQLKQRIQTTCMPGEEVLDSIIVAFDEIAESFTPEQDHVAGHNLKPSAIQDDNGKRATVVVYLHHLLNTNKRKQCLSPPSSVAGVTKPGYPGVLAYSGPSRPVHDHVNELKALNWQAFQVRLESEEEWTFAHGCGVIEVESMAEVVAEVGDSRKELFMEAMRIK
ncbi:Hypothetical protein R9X50_00327600 [Acrodontium crateriforme]|uniref:RWD domain-containing protein n=1 Tax=Acrodontium crateriforme TaxID=150365 RepID=A0AAQ3M289_9PEZI|nr:Hypothetical protein R9X50_00327600 [Acrodontium crateriforme]